MKNVTHMSAILPAFLLLTACSAVGPISEENPYERISAINGYYEGETIWFLHTDVSNKDNAEKLSKMVNYRTHYSEKLGTFEENKAGNLYIFTNGINHKGKKPWGGGPFNFQVDVFDSIPGNPLYTPIRRPLLVTWNSGSTPRILRSVAEIKDAEQNGEVTIVKPEGILINVPIIKWPGGQSRFVGP